MTDACGATRITCWEVRTAREVTLSEPERGNALLPPARVEGLGECRAAQCLSGHLDQHRQGDDEIVMGPRTTDRLTRLELQEVTADIAPCGRFDGLDAFELLDQVRGGLWDADDPTGECGLQGGDPLIDGPSADREQLEGNTCLLHLLLKELRLELVTVGTDEPKALPQPHEFVGDFLHRYGSSGRTSIRSDYVDDELVVMVKMTDKQG